MPLRSHVPGADDSIHTSEIFHNAMTSSSPLACFKSRPIESLFFATLGLVGAVRSGAACEKGRGRSEWVTAGTLDVNDFGAELGQLRADVGLGDQHAGADCSDAGEWSKRRHQGGCRRPLQLLDPVRDLASVLLDPVVAYH